MHALNGGCHCGALRIEAQLTRTPAAYSPRACDCDFCRKHGAAYVSDPHGVLRLHIADEGHLRRYRQGSGIAECLLCGNCGVVVAVTYRHDGKLYATVNAKTIDGPPQFAAEKSISPKTLSPDEKIARWTQGWFAAVELAVD